jgi:hypothetical protein
MEKVTTLITALDAVTATTTSPEINIKGAKKVSFIFTRADNAGGTSTFSVTGSIDGTNYYTLNKLINNLANTNAQTLTRTASLAIAASNGSLLASLDLEHDTLDSIKVTVTETADGTHSAKVLVEY